MLGIVIALLAVVFSIVLVGIQILSLRKSLDVLAERFGATIPHE
jgi:uncharacterized membrane protein (DUF485 family)